jgi:hypothetical protein
MKLRFALVALGVILLVGLVVATQIGFYSVQPIGALPDGVTLVVWRNSGAPFFDSPDGECLRRTGGVSLMCRAVAMGNAPKGDIILRLPYWEFAYLQSTDGATFDR